MSFAVPPPSEGDATFKIGSLDRCSTLSRLNFGSNFEFSREKKTSGRLDSVEKGTFVDRVKETLFPLSLYRAGLVC